MDRVRDAANQLTDYLLCKNEPKLTGQIEGTSGCAEWFSPQGPRDRRGRALRQLDLRRRLMRYPRSYMIYWEPFDRLAGKSKSYAYERMWDVLSGDEHASFQNLTAADRRAIIEIVRDTKPDLPRYFKQLAKVRRPARSARSPRIRRP
jgi:hypothetical protein